MNSYSSINTHLDTSITNKKVFPNLSQLVELVCIVHMQVLSLVSHWTVMCSFAGLCALLNIVLIYLWVVLT